MNYLLLVDDEPALLKMLAWRLKSQGYSVATAQSTDLALKKIAESPPHMIITDIRMPDKDGVYLIKEVKKSYPEMPCIVMSGHGDNDIKKMVNKVSCCHFIPKPLNFEELAFLINSTFN